jgi:WD40 repeat protein
VGEIFISHASADGVLAGQVAEVLRRAGHDIFLDNDRVDGIAPGATWQRTLLRKLQTCDAVVFLNSLAGQASMWCHSELVVAIDLGKRIYPFDLCPDVPPHPLLQSLQAIRLDTVIEASIDRLVGSLDSDGLAGAFKLRWQDGRPPYPGLAAMDVADAGVFFGREDEIRGLVARIDGPLGQRDGDLVVVIGPSGAGKSSLVRAGLAPRLAAPGSGWVVAAPFEPGIKPLDRLVSRLVALVPGQLADQQCTDRLLTGGMAGLGEWLVDHAGFPARRLLITVDEAEQLVTVTSPAERDEFLAVLSAGMSPGSPVTVVMTVRSDRFDEIQRLPAIGSKIRSPFVIAAINRSRLAAVIEGPATRAELAFAPGLAGRLADDAIRGSRGEAADALPFLAFTLREMYDLLAGQDRSVFVEDDYEQVGQIEGAITRRTQATETSLPPESGPFLDRLLPRFVALSEDRPPAGRPVRRDALTTAEREIVAQLEDQRLLTGTGDTVRLAHERLITAWPRLAAAVDECRDDLLLQARLERQARDWKHGNGELPGRDAARAAASWLQRAEADTVRGLVKEYVHAARRALRRRRAGTASLLCLIVTLAVAASAVAVVAVIKSDDAINQSHVAQSGAMAADAVSLFPANAPRAMLLSLAAYERDHTLQAGDALIQAAAQPLDDLLADGHPVACVAFSPNGRILAVGDGSAHVGLWDLAADRRTASLAEGGAVSDIAFSPNGRILAADDGSGHIGLWNLATGRHTATLAEASPVNSIAFSPNGRILAAGDDGDDVVLWDVATSRRIGTLFEGSAALSVAFSPSGRTLAAGDFSGDIGLWDVATQHETAGLVAGSAGDSVYSVAFSPNGRTLAAGDVDGDIGLWNARTDRPTATLAEGSSVDSVAFSPDSRTLAAGDVDGDIGLWNVRADHRISTLAEGSGVSSVAFSPDGQRMAAGDIAGDIGLWNVAPGQRTAALAEGSGVSSVAFSPDSRFLAAGENGGDIGLWDRATGGHIDTFAEGSPVVSVAFSRNGQTLAAGDNSGDVGLWDVSTGLRTDTLPEGSGVTSVAFSPNGRTLAVGDDSGDVGLWDITTGLRTRTLRERSGVTSVAFSPDGRTLAVGDDSGDVGLWDVSARHLTRTLAEGSGVTSVAFSPDGRTLAVADNSGGADLWAVATGQPNGTLFEGSPVVSVAFSPNGQAIVTGDDAGNVAIWNANTGQLFGSLAERNTGGSVDSATFSPNGLAVAAGQANGGIALLRQNLSEPSQRFFTHLICGKVQEDITPDQWAQYVPGEPYQKTCPSYP